MMGVGVMPKELIHRSGPDSAPLPGVFVGWERDGNVQIGVQQDVHPQPSNRVGTYMTVAREEINELIRVLRRARDQAYGRDE